MAAAPPWVAVGVAFAPLSLDPLSLDPLPLLLPVLLLLPLLLPLSLSPPVFVSPPPFSPGCTSTGSTVVVWSPGFPVVVAAGGIGEVVVAAAAGPAWVDVFGDCTTTGSTAAVVFCAGAEVVVGAFVVVGVLVLDAGHAGGQRKHNQSDVPALFASAVPSARGIFQSPIVSTPCVPLLWYHTIPLQPAIPGSLLSAAVPFEGASLLKSPRAGLIIHERQMPPVARIRNE